MRTFIAIDLPLSVQQTLAKLQQTMKQRVDASGAGRAVRWTSVDKAHLTLRFLGETSEAQSASLTAALKKISAAQFGFELTVQDVGCFPNIRRPSVLWIGVGGDLATLGELQSATEAAARRAGFDPETRAYSPHLTIARVNRNANSRTRREIGQELARFGQPVQSASFRVDHFTHIQSVLKPDGAVYTPLARYRF